MELVTTVSGLTHGALHYLDAAHREKVMKRCRRKQLLYRAHLSVCVCVSVCQSVGRKVYCGKTADWIRMPFGMVNRVGRRMGVLDGGDDLRREGAVFGAYLGVPL